MLNPDTHSSQLTIGFLIPLIQVLAFGLLEGDQRIFMCFLDTLIPFVNQEKQLWRQRSGRLIKQLFIVDSTGTMGRLQNTPGFEVDDELAFQCMGFALTTVVTFLFFLGRSIGVSVASTTITRGEGSSEMSTGFFRRAKSN